MGYSITFSGGCSGGTNFSQRLSKRPMGESFPSSKAIDHIKSAAIGAGRSALSDPTSTNSGGATVAFAQAIGALSHTRLLKDIITMRVIDGHGSMRVFVKKSGWVIDDYDAQTFTLRKNMLDSELVNLIKFLGKNDLNALGPYSDFSKLFSSFSQKCRKGNFVCMVEFET